MLRIIGAFYIFTKKTMGIYKIVNDSLNMVNRTKSARFNSERKNTALQTAVRDFVNDRYDNFKVQRKAGHHFEGLQRIKDELNELVVINSSLTFANNLITLPVDYEHELAFEIKINGIWQPSSPANYNELQELNKNFHTRPSSTDPYHKRFGRTLEILFGGVGTVNQVRLSYLKAYKLPYMNDDPAQLIFAGSNVLVVGQQYVVIDSTPVVHNSTTYNEGQTFIAVSTLLTGSGKVAKCQDVELPEIASVEISRMMAVELSGSVENYSKMQSKSSEVERK